MKEILRHNKYNFLIYLHIMINVILFQVFLHFIHIKDIKNIRIQYYFTNFTINFIIKVNYWVFNFNYFIAFNMSLLNIEVFFIQILYYFSPFILIKKYYL